MKNEGGARGYVSVQINTASGNAVRTHVQLAASDPGWKTAQYVLEIPDNARRLAIDAGRPATGVIK